MASENSQSHEGDKDREPGEYRGWHVSLNWQCDKDFVEEVMSKWRALREKQE